MNIRKSMCAAAALLTALMTLTSCGKTVYTGKEGMQQYARDYYENDEMTIVGTSYDKSETLAWFRYTNGPYKRCEAATFYNTPDGGFTAENNELVLKQAKDIWLCMWHRGFSVHVENPECAKVYIADPDHGVTIEITETPYTFFYPQSQKSGETIIFYYDKNDRQIT